MGSWGAGGSGHPHSPPSAEAGEGTPLLQGVAGAKAQPGSGAGRRPLDGRRPFLHLLQPMPQ